ncbi:MAG TPA: polysaccharide deacetylase family protein [Kiritimatiellia bacterium]|nr:polysaccharide deacetylase family protein [Kiritimatiellia bacterium]
MKHIRFRWPDWKPGALTTSWDDGTEFDRNLVAVFNQYGLKGSFYLNSGALGKTARESGWKNFVKPDEVATLYRGQEIGSHTVSHPHVWQVPGEVLRREFLADRERLEQLAGYPIRGAVIPFGWPAGGAVLPDLLAAWGFRYARYSPPNDRFDHPGDFLRWQPNAHCSADLETLWRQFESRLKDMPGALFYLWGHSYEFEDRKEWSKIETWSRIAGATDGVWHATNGQIYDYLTAWRQAAWSADGSIAYNASAQALFFTVDGAQVRLDPGQTQRIA